MTRPTFVAIGRPTAPALRSHMSRLAGVIHLVPTESLTAMARRRQIYEGKAKILYEGPEPGTLIQYFKDDATAFNAQKRGTINGKGVLNNRISSMSSPCSATSACRRTSSAASTCANS